MYSFNSNANFWPAIFLLKNKSFSSLLILILFGIIKNDILKNCYCKVIRLNAWSKILSKTFPTRIYTNDHFLEKSSSQLTQDVGKYPRKKIENEF
jgi:hypothetical protein